MLEKLGVVFVLVLLVLTIAPAGSPLQLSYVYSDSMEPTIGTDDGFLLTPTASVETGDVVTFWSPERDSYVTHRIVDRSPDGYVTKGDNNPTTDQAAGYAAVEPDRITGTVVTFRGDPVTIPGFGLAVATFRDSSQAVLAVLALLFLVRSVRSGDGDSRSRRSHTTVRDVLTPLLAAGVLTLVVLVVLGGAVHQFTFVAVGTASDAPNTLTVGEPESTTVVVDRSESPFTRTVVSAERMTIDSQAYNDTAITVVATIPPQGSVGAYTTRVQVRKYPAVLPRGLLVALEAVHPVVAASLTSLLTLSPVYLLGLVVLDGRTPIRPSRSRWARRLGRVFE